MPHITALPIVVPFIAAAVLATIRPLAARWANDSATLASVAGVVAIGALLLHQATGQPYAYWLGGWHPAHGVTIGISLALDPLGVGAALFSSVLVLAAIVYSLRYFDSIDGFYHALMLLFCGAMAGFCLTGDLFNLVVFFELMGTVAYALTAHRIEERAPIQGALNFAITNSVAGYAMFVGVALVYARTGALNMAQAGAALNGSHLDPLVIVAMSLLFAGFLTKAAIVPLHFWLADAHAVAPTPVCVLFSGIMIELGIYAVARLYWVVFAGPLQAHAVTLRAVLVAAGTITALVGATMCTLQRHVKRLLAFSSVSHVGMFLCGIGLLEHKAVAGVAVYVVGHGLTKGALFMCAGVLLHRFGTVDEYDLHGRGRELPLVGIIFAVGGLLLASLPPFTTFAGKSLLDASASGAGYGWLVAVFVIVSALTGGAVLRVCGRVFVGWGPTEGPYRVQEEPAGEDEEETGESRERTPPLMIAAPAALIVLALAVGLIPGAVPGVEHASALFTDHGAYTRWILHARSVVWPTVAPSHISADDVVYGVVAVAGALAAAALGLFGRGLRQRVPEAVRAPGVAALRGLRELHSGHIGDYIAWWTAGVGVLGGTCLVALR